MIEVKNVFKSFSSNFSLRDISCLFYPGKVNMIIGESGSGKTTLLKLMIGLHSLDKGKILFEDKNYFDLNTEGKNNLRRQIGMLFQQGALFDFMNVLENVKFPLSMLSDKSEKEINLRAKFCLERVNLLSAQALMPSELSGGMVKRVAIARAISMNPKYLFCDEPNSGLDPNTSIIIDDLIKEITEEYNITTIINTHDMRSVVKIGSNIIYLSNGLLEWSGNKKEIKLSKNISLNTFFNNSKIKI